MIYPYAVDRQPPRATSDEIDLYIRTYYSLLRSSGDVRVRAFEEAHLFSRSSLHLGAEDPGPDLAAFAYSAGRLPDCMPRIRRIVLGQSLAQFEAAGTWSTAGRASAWSPAPPLRWDGETTLAAFIASASDIDDLVPILTSYQLEWNKLRERLLSARISDVTDDAALTAALDDPDGVRRLRGALGPRSSDILTDMLDHDCDLFLRLLDGSFHNYQRSAQRWWNAIAPAVPPGRPVYFVSSNSHSLANLLGGYARVHKEEILGFLRRQNFEDLAPRYDAAVAAGDHGLATNILYYALRSYIHEPGQQGATGRMAAVQESDAAGGIRSIPSPGKIDVDAQVIELSLLRPENLDPRVHVPGIERLAQSRAVIVNIDYPLGMAAYHHLTAVALGVEELRGIYIMGKAATLNGRVGDVMISKIIHDEHSSNTYMFRNALVASDVQPFMKHGTVLDNQKALTVRSAFLQNRQYMDVFYREGYTVMEMEGGPYLSAAYEMAEPRRHPQDELVSLVDTSMFELGVIHYASDTPYSRRQSLLSKSMSYFGMESTYGCASAIARRIFASELSRLGG